jgi:hypothetical protein
MNAKDWHLWFVTVAHTDRRKRDIFSRPFRTTTTLYILTQRQEFNAATSKALTFCKRHPTQYSVPEVNAVEWKGTIDA